jgi:catechol 2,3-dioxygenase-like lactoylglutathione lyase family enzyme
VPKRKSARPRRRAVSRAARPRRAARKPSARTAAPRRRTRGASTTTTRRAAPRAPGGIGARVLHMNYNTHDLPQIKRFYTETLGFSNFEHDPRFDFLWVETTPGSSLGFMPPLPGPPEQWRPPREPSIYFEVQDVDRAHAMLAAKGVIFEQPPTDMPWGHRTAVLRDPEGRLVCLAQALPTEAAKRSSR